MKDLSTGLQGVTNSVEKHLTSANTKKANAIADYKAIEKANGHLELAKANGHLELAKAKAHFEDTVRTTIALEVAQGLFRLNRS